MTKQAISQEMHCLPHLFMSELWGVQEGRHHRHQSSALCLRLHVALIDFSPSLQKCAINQYSNKSSFILEKCSFQLTGHKVLVLSVWARKRLRSVFGLGPHLPNMTVHHQHDTTTHTTSMQAHEQKHFKCVAFTWSIFCNLGSQL